MSDSAGKPGVDGVGVRSILVNTAYLSAARFVTVAAKLVFVVLVARLLGPELYGQFNYGLSWYLLFLPLGIVGMDTLLAREVGRRRGDEGRKVGNSLSILIVAAILATALSVAVGVGFEQDAQILELILIFALALLGRSFAHWSFGVIKGAEASRYLLYQELVFRLLEVGIGITLLLTGFGVVELAWTHAVIWLSHGAMGFLLIRKLLFRKIRPCWEWVQAKELLSSGVLIMLSGMAVSWLLFGPLIVFRHVYDNPDTLGQVALALQAFLILGSFLVEMSSAAIPVVTRSIERGDGKVRPFARLLIVFSWFFIGLSVLFAFVFGEPLMVLVMGDSFALAGKLLPWALVLVGLYFSGSIVRGILVAAGEHLATMLGAIFSAIVFSLSVWVMPEVMHVHGVFLSAVIGFLAYLGYMIYSAYPTLKETFGWLSFKSVVVLFVSWGVCLYMLPMTQVGALGMGVVLIFLLGWILKILSAEDQEIVLSLILRKKAV